MKWIREKIRSGALLALFALAVQMALSFGHVHGDLLSTRSAAIDAASSQLAADPASSDRPSHSPAAQDFCAVCASIGAFGSLILPMLSAHRTVLEFDRVAFLPLAADALPNEAPIFKQARAPPSV
jgi:hypothetical protein